MIKIKLPIFSNNFFHIKKTKTSAIKCKRNIIDVHQGVKSITIFFLNIVTFVVLLYSIFFNLLWFLFTICKQKKSTSKLSSLLGAGAHIYNPSYSGSGEQEDHSSQLDHTKLSETSSQQISLVWWHIATNYNGTWIPTMCWGGR
jgi:hypothetical protein